VTLDNTPKGATPVTIEELPNDRRYRVALKLEGYKSWSKRVNFEGKTSKTVSATLKAKKTKATGGAKGPLVEIAINTTPPASVIVNGRKTNRRTPLWPGQGLKLPVGTHTISFETQDSARYNYEVTLVEGEVNKLIIRRLGGPPQGNIKAKFKD